MKRKIKSILSYIMVFLLAFSTLNIFGINARAADQSLLQKVNAAIEKTHNYIIKNNTWSSDWKTVAFNKSGLSLPEGYNSSYLKGAAKSLEESGGYFYKVTDYERTALAVTAAGGDPANVGGYNLLDKIYNFNDPQYPDREIDFQGLNGVVYGLIALDSKNYEVPAGAKYTREYMLDYILNNRNSDGGWDLNMNGTKSDVDITAMTLISLAPHHDYVSAGGKTVKDAVDGAVEWLSKAQRQDGGFNSWLTENNSESCAQAIIGLCANGVDPAGPQFTKDTNLIENILKFQQKSGEFYHLLDGREGVNGMATEQAYQAIIAYRDFANGKGSIYWFDGGKTPEADDMKAESISQTTNYYADGPGIDQDIFIVTGEESTQRLYGQDRFETSLKIAEKLASYVDGGKFQNVVISSGLNFPDSLSGSVLAKKLNAPILLTGNNAAESQKAINYVNSNLDKSGNIYILGGEGAVDISIENSLKELGYSNIKRIWGQDRFETSGAIAGELNVAAGTPVVIVNGMSFADALSAGAAASIKGYPVLLSDKDTLPSNIKSYISNIKPSDVYVIGGEGVLAKSIESEISSLNPSSKITRLFGMDRYQTSLRVNEFFNYNEYVLLATGEDYPDALSGCALAAAINGSILLVDDTSINTQLQFINKDNTNSVIILGGSAVVSGTIENAAKQVLSVQ
ncbi:N-acetylmuramoyl-L-alanine amidase LytC precursor [Oxobacter pfennigii]|uniref:N-acetylmuramoyl-L-alanine amidase LytC n=1 Tax=Oxobacter pfennigii TaxID=36849 RepID=A0A0P8W6J0_9CLOT|nr:cell wall-binding repeat-containing protein [Oxobacter pfennigii]KPU43364.1 N-acetylmuramoyl-L-alanine amidase LytC precursor [Oxobacter pfennigii]